MYIARRNSPAIVLAGSILYILTYVNNISLTTQTFEIYLVIFLFGMSLFMYSTKDFLLAAVVAMVAIIFTSISNPIAIKFIFHMDIYTKQAVNVATILCGFVFSIAIFMRYRPIKCIAPWSIPTHFLLLGIFQRDQFGTDFLPYTYDNPVQWIPTAIFAIALGSIQLIGPKKASCA